MVDFIIKFLDGDEKVGIINRNQLDMFLELPMVFVIVESRIKWTVFF
jgi:hypothetical protein